MNYKKVQKYIITTVEGVNTSWKHLMKHDRARPSEFLDHTLVIHAA